VTLRPAAFLDRDGTIMGERHYLADPRGVELIPGALEALRALRDADFALVIVTNQAGIARGLYTLDDYHAVAARLDEVLEAEGVPVDGTWFCPHHPDKTGPCACRKPGTGMYLEAARSLGLDVEASYYVGDKITDVLPAAELGGRGILVRTGYGNEHETDVTGDVWVVDDVREAADRILTDSGR
jgi:D-glycero-D-manno-heptose 1,7-bisphosphate phosphatase